MNENNMKLITVENFAIILAESVMSKNEEPWSWNDYSFVYYDGTITDDLVFAYSAVEHMWCGIHCIDTGFDSFDPNFITDIYGGGCPNIYSIDLDMDKELIKNEFEKIILNIINKTGPIFDVDEDAIVLIEKSVKEDNAMVNEFDTPQDRTKNFEDCQNAMKDLSITDIVKVVDYINELSTFIPSNNEVLDYLSDIVEPIVKVIDKCRTDKECPHCGCYLFKSDLPQYSYVCAECDENFDECEVK